MNRFTIAELLKKYSLIFQFDCEEPELECVLLLDSSLPSKSPCFLLSISSALHWSPPPPHPAANKILSGPDYCGITVHILYSSWREKTAPVMSLAFVPAACQCCGISSIKADLYDFYPVMWPVPLPILLFKFILLLYKYHHMLSWTSLGYLFIFSYFHKSWRATPCNQNALQPGTLFTGH